MRRAGAAVICVSGALALLGFTALTLAYETWSGYVIQAVCVLILGLLGVAGGWSLLRQGDRVGPRLVSFPRMSRGASFAPDPSATGGRVWVRSEPIAALPPVRRSSY